MQEWLKEYVYRHIRKRVHPILAVFLVLILSALEHDFQIAIGFGFFMPMYLVEYGLMGEGVVGGGSVFTATQRSRDSLPCTACVAVS